MGTSVDYLEPAIGEPKKLPLARTPERKSYEGIVTGIIGAAAIAFFFLVIDVNRGRPLYTPSLLGTALFRGRAAIGAGDVPVSIGMAAAFTVIHVLVFLGIGSFGVALTRFMERHPDSGFGVIMFGAAVFLYGFQAVCMIWCDALVEALSWQAMFVANLVACGSMAVYLHMRHPKLEFSLE
jgi:hypothetical protein